jgi:uncharacterized protein (DUF1778 family)
MPENNPYQKQILDEYIEKLITELSIGNYPPEDQEAMLEDVHNRFEELILSTTLLMLDSEQRTEFEKALDLPEDEMEIRIAEITSEVDGLDKAIEAALERELSAIKQALK